MVLEKIGLGNLHV